MSFFHPEKIEMFLGVVRKYMQVRGAMSQKELAELVGIGVSTMSRFLSQKTSELNPQLIAKIIAKLNIPLHETIDFVEEENADEFIRLVKFYKEDPTLSSPVRGASENEERSSTSVRPDEVDADEEEDWAANLEEDTPRSNHGQKTGTARRNVSGKINVGGKTRTISYQAEGTSEKPEEKLSVREKLESLSPRQRAYMTEFLDLDMESRDLMVDIGNNLLRYFKQRGMDF